MHSRWKSRASVGVGLLLLVNSAAAAAYSLSGGDRGVREPAAAAAAAPAPAAASPPAPSAIPTASPQSTTSRVAASPRPTSPQRPAPPQAPPSPRPFAGRGGLQVRPDVSVLAHRVAAYDVSPADFARVRAIGIDTPLLSGPSLDDASRADLRRLGMRYIDVSLSGLVSSYVPSACRQTPAPCVLPPDREAELLQRVQTLASQLTGDDLLVGLYALDDYPGNISDLLIQIHALMAGVGRPMICPFMTFLDAVSSTGRVLHDRTIPERAVINYTPQACDVVSVYAYAPELQQFTSVDWAMSSVLPDVGSLLAARGWNRSEPIIGTAQAFSMAGGRWVGPTADQIRAQTAAFCARGAFALMPFAWNEGVPGTDLSRDPAMQRGLTAGIADCHRIWGIP